MLYPSDATSAAALVRAMADRPGVVYLRTTRGAYPVLYEAGEPFPVGGSKVLRSTPSDAVTLIAVSKTFGAQHIRPVLEAGHRVFGENRVQEAKAKWPQLRQDYAGIALHLIGPLQSNKAKEAVLLFDAIHSIDRPKIAEAVARLHARGPLVDR